MAESMKPTVVLTKEQIEFYHREGYLSLPALMPANEIEKMKVIYDGLFAAQVGRNTGDFFDLGGRDDTGKPVIAQMMNPSKFAPELNGEWQFKINAAAIARQLQGDKSYFRQDLAICKPPKSPAPTPWHQDAAYNEPEFDYDNINFWIPLQDVPVEFGCLQFIPRKHTSTKMLNHVRPDPKIEAVTCTEINLSEAVACPLPAGGCTIHHARTPHYAGPNASDGPRRAFILEYEVPPIRRAVAHDYPWNKNRDTRRLAQYNRLSVRVGNKLKKLGRLVGMGK